MNLSNVHRIARAPGRYFVFWVLGNRCTYACSYCPTHFHDGSFAYHETESVIRTLKSLPPANVMFSGGEPTYHPDFEYILDNRPSHVGISVISNASRPLAFWERIIPKINFVILTYHVEFANLDRFIGIAKACGRKLDRINLTMLAARWEECVSIYERLKLEGLPVVPKTLVKEFGAFATTTEDYAAEQRQWLSVNKEQEKSISLIMFDRNGKDVGRSTPSELLANKNTDFRGWICDVPMQSLYIDYTKKVFDSSCKQRRFLGTIDEGFDIPTTPVQCYTSFCWCHSDLMATKVKSRRFDKDNIATHVESDENVKLLGQSIMQRIGNLWARDAADDFAQLGEPDPKDGSEVFAIRRLVPKVIDEIATRRGLVQGADCEDTKWRDMFPEIDSLIMQFLSNAGFKMEELGRIWIGKLPPGGEIIQHMDVGYYFHYYNQLYIPLQSNPGFLYRVGPDKDRWKETAFEVGCIYEVNNSRNHSAVNRGDEAVVYLVVDLKLARPNNAKISESATV